MSQAAQRWVLGLDGGGSKTALAYGSSAGEVVGPFLAPGVNPFDQPDWDVVLRNILTAYPAPGPLEHATLGLPGYGESPEINAQQDALCAELLPGPHTVMNDVEAAFAGAFAGGGGVLLLSGTGSMAWTEDGTGTLRIGGWGEGFGDEGSGYWIGRRALEVASQALDGRHADVNFASALLTPVLGSVPTQPGLLTWYYGQTHVRSAVAALARSVDALAEAGQPTAHGILLEAAELLARHVSAARGQLGHPALPWSHAGGVLGSRTVRNALRSFLGEAQAPVLPPLGGALFQAASRAGFQTDRAWQQSIRAALFQSPTATSPVQESP